MCEFSRLRSAEAAADMGCDVITDTCLIQISQVMIYCCVEHLLAAMTLVHTGQCGHLMMSQELSVLMLFL